MPKNIMFDYKERLITIEYGEKAILDNINSTIFEVFKDKAYAKFDVKGIPVLDIGGFYGESALYFLCEGASFVYVAEPMGSFFYCAANLYQNKFENYKAYKIAAGDPSKGADIEINDSFINYGNSNVKDGVNKEVRYQDDTGNFYLKATDLVKVPVANINDFVKNCNLKDGLLKVDCEGSEYDFFFSSSKEAIRTFKYIEMEIHPNVHERTPDELIRFIADCGFKVAEVREAFNNYMAYFERKDE